MVQEITGFPVPFSSSTAGVLVAAASEPAPVAPSWPPAPACVLPTLDTSAFLLHRAATTVPAPEEKNSSRGGAPATAVTAAAPGADDDPCSVLQELEAMACAPGFVSDYPTLESWGII
uniref:Uncharacterized protein n=1 Tax=Arundo donax TaxID=35708 RepID=A0A0A9CUW7_ARUDO